ncbi:prolipoprotein diacylglyceryl transferase [Fulvivirga sp. M361]|uniref:prolipoprotein diacylglyceryl transferase n=1 Tax=Fulvivirga sp. M361 TaxID=2594266 RepID=UPI0021046AF8|nr:prolipoprotein diacylglyceryl transferase [Fulvivirga sp. M361]
MIWGADPEIFVFPEWLPFISGRPVRWYGLLFALGFLISQQIMFYIYRNESKPEKDVETLTIFMVIATILGARLGHVFFYEPDKYLANPIDILKIWEGGLASHGAAFGILLALWLYTKYDISWKFQFKKVSRPNQNWLQVVDRIVIVVALTGCLIRMGNFMNSEIYGVPTGSGYGVVFSKNLHDTFLKDSSPIEKISAEHAQKEIENKEGYVPLTLEIAFKNQPEILTEGSLKKYLEGRFTNILFDYPYLNNHILITDHKLEYTLNKNTDGSFNAAVSAYGISRHPTQLYEASTSLMIFILLFLIWNKMRIKTPDGLLLGIFLILLFGLRFVHELFKENQVSFEDTMAFNMGQLLSIPLILGGLFILVRALRLKK